MGSWRPTSGHFAQRPEEAEREGNRGEQEEIMVEWNMLPNSHAHRFCTALWAIQSLMMSRGKKTVLGERKQA